jgi:hypothetical protein
MRSMRRTGRAVAAVGLCAGLAVGMSALPASAAPGTGDGTTTNLLYSVNGGAWSDTVTAQRGDTVTARLFYDTTKDSTVTGASLTTQIPDGFTYVPGSTRNVLAPGSNVATGAVGAETKAAAVADSVWSGDQLQVSPSAGFNGESNASQSGVLRNGVKRYLNLDECDYMYNGVHGNRYVINAYGAGQFATGTNVSNNRDTAATCGGGGSGWALYGGTVTSLDLLGNRYVNLNECDYRLAGDDYSRWVINNGQGGAWGGSTNASNTIDGAAGCGPAGNDGNNEWSLRASTTSALDLLGNRYVNLHECDYVETGGASNANRFVTNRPGADAFATGTSTSPTPSASASCGVGGSGWSFNSGSLTVLDLLDTARGQGFVEFAFTSEVPGPAQCGETVTEPELVSNRQGVLNGAGTGSPSSGASVTLAQYMDEGEACPLPVELVDDDASTVVDGPTEIDVTGNDTIPDGSTGFTVDATSAQGGTVVDNGDGTITYTPAAGFVGTDTFTYRVTGPDGVERSATVTVTVTEDDEPAVPMVAGGFAAAGLLGAGLMGLRTVRSRKETV